MAHRDPDAEVHAHSEVIDRWRTNAAFARDMKVTRSTVTFWRRRGIPEHRFDDVISTMKKRGFEPVTYAWLTSQPSEIQRPRGTTGA